MIFTIRGILLITLPIASTFLVARIAGLGIAFGLLVVWLPIATSVFLHRSGRSLYYRNIAILVAMTGFYWLLLGAGYLASTCLAGERTQHDCLVDAYTHVPVFCLAGTAHGLMIAIAYCCFLTARYQLSDEIRPLNWNDIRSRPSS